METLNWIEEFPGAVTVCDAEGIVLAVNAKARESYQSSGGAGLIGTNLLDCHPEPSRTKVKEMLRSGRPNVYTIEKNGAWKLIYQSPWYVAGNYRGLVQLAMEIPAETPHFER
jgi:transcriptional regulator with PAS, ATPase and Fis domain